MFVAVGLSGQWARLTGRGGAYVEYLVPATAAGKSAGDLVRAVAANLLQPVAIPVTLGAVVALMPVGWRARGPAGLLGIGASRESRATYRLAPGVLALSAVLWRWHPWDVTRKWSLYLHALSAVLALRLVADVLASLLPPRDPGSRHAGCGRRGPPSRRWLVVGLSLHAATKRRVHAFDLTAALQSAGGRAAHGRERRGRRSPVSGPTVPVRVRAIRRSPALSGGLPNAVSRRAPAADRSRDALPHRLRESRDSGARTPRDRLPDRSIVARPLLRCGPCRPLNGSAETPGATNPNWPVIR